MKKVFLGGSFQTKDEEDFLRDIYNSFLEEGYEVWWAPVKVGRGYGTKNEKHRKYIVETEKRELRTSHAAAFVVKKATFGTWGEILDAYEHGIPAVVYVLSENSGYSKDFESAWFAYHVDNIVYKKEDLLQELRKILG